ncbi:MAG TPA: CBS domain-containing protein [Anaerolineales bacterium]
MKVKDIMTKEVQVIHPNDSLQTAAQKMSSHDIGFLPVLEADQLVGVITDRDLVLRGIAQGMNSNAMLGRELMTSPVIYCFEDQDIKEVAKLMEESQIRRLVILSRSDKRLVGVVSLGDLALNSKSDTSAEVLQKVSEPIG